MRITFVKKVLASGEPCAKCRDVEERLERSGLMSRIDRVVVADERDETSEGMRLARRHNVDRAPFFIVLSDERTTVYTVYLKFVRDVFGGEPTPGSELEEARDLLRAHPDLDLV
ncbi:MAG: hypothetical protein F4X99_00855 [Gammaproteobacteria bacterium]|nr:hypothetical protein [Gammaproteobacteria bacterium]MYE83066.1 hypothetical protein [Gammaproteobacteria bacterium]